MRYRGLLLHAFLALSFAGALGAATWALPPQEPPARELPADEDGLLRYAQERMNRNAWQEADRALKALLQRHPDSARAEDVHQQLAQLHLWNSRRPAEAREWYEKACARWPKSERYWDWRFQIAQTFAQQNLRDRAAAEYRKLGKEAPDAGRRAQAVQQAWNLENRYFYMSVHRTFTAGQEPEVQVQLRRIEKIDFRAVHIPFAALLPHLHGSAGADLHEAVAKVPAEARRPLKAWTATYTYGRDNEWKNETVKVPSTEPGVYLVEGEYDGVTISVTVFVSRYGLTAKAAAGKLLCFVQDRATSKPAAGVAIKVLHGTSSIDGTTNAQGLFVADGFKGGVVLAMKDGDLATTHSYYHAVNGERPLIHISTDRPIYRPNQTVRFRIVRRTEKGETLEVEPERATVVEIRDAKGNKIYEQVHRLDVFGSTEGELLLGDEPPLGEYLIVTRDEKEDPNLHQHDWQWLGRWGKGPHNFVRFRVDEYRKPEYKVDVGFAKPRVLQGEAVEATIDARYYFGSPVADADVTWQVFKQPTWNVWRCWPYYYDWYADEEEAGGRHGFRGHGQALVVQGSGKTDRDGKVKVVFTAQKEEHDALYTVVAKVTDLSRRAVDGSSTCKAARAEFGLAMTLDRYVYKPGDRVNAKVRAATPDERPVAGTRVGLKAYDRRWRDGRHDDALLFEGAAVTDAQGVAEFNLSPEREGGYLWIVAEAQDARGNAVKTEQYAWLCGDGWGGSTVNLNGVDLVLDKKTYEPGDVAQVLVTSQFRDVTLLLTVESKEIHRHEVVRVNGHTKVIDLKIDRAWAPNVFVSVAGIKENAVVQRRRMLVVNPADKFVTVEATPDKAQYKPREKAVYKVLTLGADGRPVSAQVSLGVVDDSLYALQPEYAEDIRKHFVYRRGDEVVTNTSLEYHGWGRAELRAKSAAPGAPAPEAAASFADDRLEKRSGGKKEGRGAPAPTEIRSNFADTMLWTTVTTGPDGRALVTVDVPDNLTTWTATARAATLDGRFGQSSGRVVSRKDMIVRLQTPRFFTQNDRAVFSAVAHNYLKTEKEVMVEMAVEGLEVDGPRTRTIRIAPEGHARVDWSARVRTAGSATVTVKALSDEASDAMRLVVPVLPHGSLKFDSRAGLVEGKVVERVVIPGGPTKEGADLTVVVSPTHAAMVLDALEYLAGYPYGCVEQTMSRFLPTVVVSKALQRLGIEKKDLQAELPSMVSTGLQRLYNFQQQDGGWGWWQNDASNPWTTAYVMTGLGMARAADHAVEPHVFTRGLQALQRHLAASTEPEQQAYLLYALSTAGIRSDDVRSRLTDRLSDLKPYGKALLALVLVKDGLPAKEVLASLERDAKVVGGAVHFEGGARGGWMDHDMEVSAAALRAFLAVEPKHPLVGRLVHWLSTVRQGNYWGSTKQTAWVVFSLVEYLAQSGDLTPDMTLTLTLNGERIFSERVTKENWHAFNGRRTFKGGQLRDGENEIVIERTGNGTPLYSVYGRTYAEGEDIEASKGAIQVERTYGKVVWENKERRVLPLRSGATVASGDEIEVTVTVRADRDHEWLMLDIPMPSGFEAIRDDPRRGRWGWWYSHKEFRDEKVCVAMTRLNRGAQQISYVMRAEAPGDVHVLPAVVFNMYHPEIGGNSDEFRLTVSD